MMRKFKRIKVFGVFILVLVILPGCIGQVEEEPAPFSIEVFPEYMQDTIPGQKCIFLVSVTNNGEGHGKGEAVTLSATASSSTVTISTQAIISEEVAEVTVIPDTASLRQNVTVTIDGEREGLTQTLDVVLTVNEPVGSPKELVNLATEILDEFISWLAANHPEFGITGETEWEGTIVRPNIMVVMFYLFFSEEWEMGVSWHVMTPPSDWARIYLRNRTTEMTTSYAFEITSRAAGDDPHEITLADAFAETVFR